MTRSAFDPRPLRGGLFLLALVATLALPRLAQAQLGGPPKVSFKAAVEPSEVARGGKATLRITAKVRSGYHIYALEQPEGAIPLPTKITLRKAGPLVAGVPGEPAPSIHQDEFTGAYNYHEDEVTFTVPLAVSLEASPGEVEIEAAIAYMACTWEFCDPPATGVVKATVTVREETVAATGTATGTGTETGTETETGTGAGAGADADDGLLSLILIALAAGFGALATPCVFPMIPITVSFFTKEAEKGKSLLGLATAYAVGIVVSFTGFGILLAALKGATGAQAFASNPWVNMGIGALFVVFALSLFGLFELRLPAGLVNSLDRMGRSGSNFAAVMFMGFTFTLAAFTCTMPFMGAVLAQAARGDVLRPVIGMLFFSSAFALPFFLLALFPSLITSIRKKSGGSFMHSVKVTMGFIELAAAFKFLSNADLIWQWELLTREVVLAAWVGIFGFNGIYLLGFFRMKDEPEEQGIGTLRMLTALFFVSLTLYLTTGMGGNRLGGLVDSYLPPMRYPSSVSGGGTDDGGALHAASPDDATPSGVKIHADLFWMEDVQEALDLAKVSGNRLFLNFTGDT
jgi:thiol:disulfide interchange protein DsbD